MPTRPLLCGNHSEVALKIQVFAFFHFFPQLARRRGKYVNSQTAGKLECCLNGDSLRQLLFNFQGVF
jgi:hypothetical protein